MHSFTKTQIINIYLVSLHLRLFVVYTSTFNCNSPQSVAHTHTLSTYVYNELRSSLNQWRSRPACRTVSNTKTALFFAQGVSQSVGAVCDSRAPHSRKTQSCTFIIVTFRMIANSSREIIYIFFCARASAA